MTHIRNMRPISYLKIAFRSVRFYWRTELSVFLGTAIAAAALVGGLLVGDCVTYSLRRLALMRLGETHQAMQLQGRFFDADLATRLEAAAYFPVTPVLVLRGVVFAAQPDGEPVQVNHVQVVGVDSRFWRLAPGASYAFDRDAVGVNQKLAAQLGITEGAEISVRIGNPSLMPHDAPLAARNEAMTRRRTFTVRHVVSDDHLGRFGLAANQVAPRNLFVDIGWLQDTVDLPLRANTMLVGASVSADELSAALKQVWRPEDMGLTLRRHGAILQLESDRIFIDSAVSTAGLFAGLEAGSDAVGVLTYLVNGVSKGERTTPYSFAVATEASLDASLSLVPPEMRDDEAIINQWLSDELEAKAGDTITVSYFALDPFGGFIERERDFTVRRVDSMEAFEKERTLMPTFPGLTDVEQCREWDVGMPMEEGALQDEANQAYWEAYGATPKLVVSLAAGQEMWANRFGDLSAIRYRVRERDEPALRKSLRRAIDPAALGLFLTPVREQALKAVSEALSLGEWFAYMSFFLIAAALMLTGMLFVFGIQQRSEEIGILLGVGHCPGAVRRLFLWEGGVVALAACSVGGVLGTGYTRFLVWGLARYWQGAVANAAILYHAETSTVIMGVGSSFVCALVAMAIAMWHQTRRPARELMAGDVTAGRSVNADHSARMRTLTFSGILLLAACGTVAFALVVGDANIVTLFFGAGFLLLLAGLGFSRLLLQRLEHGEGPLGEGQTLTVSNMGLRNAARRPGRSLTVVALLAFGCFIVFAVSAMQQDLAASAGECWSGTGGFALFGESTLPVPDALETEKGRRRFGLEREDSLAGVEIVSLKVRDGDDASCFNLNRAQAPRLVGVDTGGFRSRSAFMSKGGKDGLPWSLLDVELPDGVIPGLAGDTTTVMWNLQKRVGPEVGDEIVYRTEQGEPYRVKLVGTLPMPLSVLQGTVLISKADFMARYPSESGYRMFLADVPDGVDVAAVQQALTRRLDRVGLDMTTSLDRLLAFHGVEATYLTMFLVLGGLGVVLGTFGLGIVVLRNMLERRSELAILRCVGFSRARVLWLVLAEHWMLLLLGLGCGLVSAMVAIYPSLSTPGMHVPLGGIAALLGGIVLAGLGSTGIAVFVALRGDLIPALRKE